MAEVVNNQEFKFCQNCGFKNNYEARFCQGCGKEFDKETIRTNANVSVQNNISQKENIERKIVYEGQLHKCPNCGELLDAFVSHCPACNYEIRDAKTSNFVTALAHELEKIESEKLSSFDAMLQQKRDEFEKQKRQRKVHLITTFSVPNTREDILEFMILAASHINQKEKKYLFDAWATKFQQCYDKALIAFDDKTDLDEIRALYDRTNPEINRIRRSKSRKLFLSIAIPIISFAIANAIFWTWFGMPDPKKEAREAKRLEAIVVDVEDALENKDYDLALMNAQLIDIASFKVRGNLERKWNAKRDYYIDKIIKEAAKEGIILEDPRIPSWQNNSEDLDDTSSNKNTGITSSENKDNKQEENNSSKLTITKGTEYSYMRDEYNVYVATAASDEIVKIENWSKNLSTSSKVSHEYDIGTFKINDNANEFKWIDKEHTAFSICFKDKNTGLFPKKKTLIFTVNIHDEATNKGSNYDKTICCYTYKNDDWTSYKIIPLTDKLFKVEAWVRPIALGSFHYGYDVMLIDIDEKDNGFEWIDDEHTTFSITMSDSKNSELKKEKLLIFKLENKKVKYQDTITYIEKTK